MRPINPTTPRPHPYSSADVVVICFSVVRPHTYNNVLTHWYPEVRRICGSNIPVVLVGTQIDLRYLYNDSEFKAINKGSFYKLVHSLSIYTNIYIYINSFLSFELNFIISIIIFNTAIH